VFGHATYLIFELGWGLPVLLLQWAAGHRRLWEARGILILAVAIPTLYLTAADGIAIANGVWALHSNRIVNIRIGDVPLEEFIFFLVTNAMVVQSVLLVGFGARGYSR
jgi:lycopene cyclase domain-containing protein